MFGLDVPADIADAFAGLSEEQIASLCTPNELRYFMLLMKQVNLEVKFDDLYIRHKVEETLVQFVPNETQTIYLDSILPDRYEMVGGVLTPIDGWRKGNFKVRGIRDIILKFRQPGFSTLIQGLIFLNACNRNNFHAMLVAQDDGAAQTIFQTVKTFHENLPKEKQLRLKQDAQDAIAFRDKNSRIDVRTCTAIAGGRGGTRHAIHESERAFWPLTAQQLADFDSAYEESVPMNGCIFRESTAKDVNHFFTEYQEAKDGTTNFKAKFYGWNIHKEYRLPEPVDTLTPEEEKLKADYGLDGYQLAWRRMKKRDRKEMFEREYPINDIECFAKSVENNYFNTEWLYDRIRDAQTGVFGGVFHNGNDNGWPGDAWIFAPPEKGGVYVIGVDVSEGIVGDAGHDDSTIDVFDANTREMVLSWWGKCAPKDLGDMVDFIGKEYNDALVCIERNNHGLSTIDRVVELGYPSLYSHTFTRRRNGMEVEDTDVGYPTTIKTKVIRNDTLARVVNEAHMGIDTFLVKSERALTQMMHYIKMAHGKAGGSGRNHDDHVTSIGLAVLMFDHASPGLKDWKQEAPNTPW